MIHLYLLGHPFHFEMENLTRLFFPDEKIVALRQEPTEYAGQDRIITRVAPHLPQSLLIEAQVHIAGTELQSQFIQETVEPDDETERLLAVLLWELLRKICGFAPKWGILTGVRPGKLMSTLIRDLGEPAAVDYFETRLLVSPEKTRLAVQAADAAAGIARRGRPRSFSLYISIPFCPTRCSYCSFISHSAPAALRMLPDYVEKLCEEIRITGALARKLGLSPESVYMGGGTPTVLTADQLRLVMSAVEESFDLTHVPEYTVEAGRPDTVTDEKFAVIRAWGANRVSVNPQTMDDEILRRIGRPHTASQTMQAVEMARAHGFPVLNMDLIAGLPGDSPDGFARSLRQVLSCEPENVTVHTLAIKRAARIRSIEESRAQAQSVAKMLEDGAKALAKEGLLPYYLYRQSRSVGNFENVGYARQGTECFYNVYMMEELHTVLGCGAGAVTKLKEPRGDYILRVFNHKYPYEYIGRFDELMERKKQVSEFYDLYGK